MKLAKTGLLQTIVFPLIRVFGAALLSFVLCASPLQAQMRTDRGTRSINAGTPSTANRSETGISTASYSSDREKGVSRAAHVVAKQSSHVHTASCDSCGEVESDYQEPIRFRAARSVGSCDSCGSFDACACDDSCVPSALTGMYGCDPYRGSLFRDLMRNFRFRAEGVSFFHNASTPPPLVTSGLQSSGQVNAGEIGRNDTTFLFGNTPVNRQHETGFRFNIGSSFGPDCCRGILFRAFDTGKWGTNFFADQDSNAVIARPFFDVTANEQSTVLIAFPGVARGNVRAFAMSRAYGGDILVRKLIAGGQGNRWDFLIGYQRAQLNEEVRVDSTTTSIANGTVLDLTDRFHTQNVFNGVALGLNTMARYENWSIDGMFKLGFGNMTNEVDISGFRRTFVSAGNISTENQGLLARATNSGIRTFDTFAVVPELNLTVGYRFTYNFDLTLGYSFLVLPKVARADDQINNNLQVNLSNPLVGDVAPAFTLDQTSYVLHGINYGLQWRY